MSVTETLPPPPEDVREARIRSKLQDPPPPPPAMKVRRATVAPTNDDQLQWLLKVALNEYGRGYGYKRISESKRQWWGLLN